MTRIEEAYAQTMERWASIRATEGAIVSGEDQVADTIGMVIQGTWMQEHEDDVVRLVQQVAATYAALSVLDNASPEEALGGAVITGLLIGALGGESDA